MRFDRHLGKQLIRMNDRHHECLPPCSRQSTVIRSAAASQPMSAAVGGQRGNQHHVGVSQSRDFAAVSTELQIPIRKDGWQQDLRSAAAKCLQRFADIRLPGYRAIARDYSRSADFRDGKHSRAHLAGVVRARFAGGQQPRPQRRLRRLFAHGN